MTREVDAYGYVSGQPDMLTDAICPKCHRTFQKRYPAQVYCSVWCLPLKQAARRHEMIERMKERRHGR